MGNITIIKACLNDNCDAKHMQLKCKVTDKFCMKCGQPLYHVCKKCGAVIDKDLQLICDDCIEAERLAKEAKKSRTSDDLKHAGDAAKVVAPFAAPAAAFGVKVAAKLVKGSGTMAKGVRAVAKIIEK